MNVKEMKSVDYSDLIQRARKGEQSAYTELYELTNAAVFRTVCSMVRDEDEAWDILQNSYIRAFKNLDQLKNTDAFLPWLRRIAVNETTSVMSRNRPITFTELAGEDDTLRIQPENRVEFQPELQLDRKENARLVRQILETLPREQRLLIGMFYYEEIPIKEISETLGIAVGTVKTQLFSGRKKVEAGVRKLEQQGIKLYGLSPVAFLLTLLRNLEPAEITKTSVLGKLMKKTVSAGLNSAAEPVFITAQTVRTGFLYTLGGKLTAAILAISLICGGAVALNAINQRQSKPMGDYQPTSQEHISMIEQNLISSKEPELSTWPTTTEAPAANSREPVNTQAPTIPPSETSAKPTEPSQPEPTESSPEPTEPISESANPPGPSGSEEYDSFLTARAEILSVPITDYHEIEERIKNGWSPELDWILPEGDRVRIVTVERVPVTITKAELSNMQETGKIVLKGIEYSYVPPTDIDIVDPIYGPGVYGIITPVDKTEWNDYLFYWVDPIAVYEDEAGNISYSDEIGFITELGGVWSRIENKTNREAFYFDLSASNVMVNHEFPYAQYTLSEFIAEYGEQPNPYLCYITYNADTDIIWIEIDGR